MAFGSSAFGTAAYGSSEALFDEVAHHLAAAMAAYRVNDPAWKEHVRHLSKAAAELKRKAGAPKKSRGKNLTKPEQQAAHYALSGDYKTTAEALGVKEDTVRRNVARVDKGY